MARFDFIRIPEFRDSLEHDYTELTTCRDSQACKSTLVLAGSIVEALLIDYLTDSPSDILRGKDPLRLDLVESITLCRNNNIISQRTADLCSVIRSYRNLIHPARQLRLNEQAPTKQSADIAVALVDLIVDEIALVRKGAFGLTAEQVSSKLVNDRNSIPLLPHLIHEVHEAELERLLLDILPTTYSNLVGVESEDFIDELIRLEKAFRIIFNVVSKLVRVKVANRFVHILKNSAGSEVDSYADAFFIPSDLAFLQDKDIPIVKEYYHSRRPSIHNPETAKSYSLLTPFLGKNDITDWLDPFLRAITSTKSSESDRSAVKNELTVAQFNLSEEAVVRVDKRLEEWISFYREKNDTERTDVMTTLLNELQSVRDLPF
ncbi:MAG: hypothetical protein V1799_19255 [bacterium]